jgi:hypothetical protein
MIENGWDKERKLKGELAMLIVVAGGDLSTVVPDIYVYRTTL